MTQTNVNDMNEHALYNRAIATMIVARREIVKCVRDDLLHDAREYLKISRAMRLQIINAKRVYM
jgi:hypothetical protein